MKTPATLLERLRQPDAQEAWQQFVRLYTPLLFHYAYAAGCRGADAEDLVQEVFALLVRELPSFQYDPQRGFRGWLRTVAVNKHRELLRKRQAHPEVQVDLAEAVSPDGLADFWEAEYRQVLCRRALELMRSAFAPATWQACWQHTACGRSAPEVAAELGITVNAVYLASSRVLRRLRQELVGLLE